MLLAFETVARTASACVGPLGGAVVARADLGGEEAERGLALLLDGLMRAHPAIDRLAVASGPGSFTGLRVGITAARTLAWLQALPLHAVDSLEARARQAGDGRWWVLMPLKRDTTFHGLFAVAGGRLELLVPTRAWPDAERPPWLAAADGAVAIGPALASKPGLLAGWGWQGVQGPSEPLRAEGVALAAPSAPAGRWQDCLPNYHQEPAPVLQRQARQLRQIQPIAER